MNTEVYIIELRFSGLQFFYELSWLCGISKDSMLREGCDTGYTKTGEFSLFYALDIPEKASFRRLPFHCCRFGFMILIWSKTILVETMYILWVKLHYNRIIISYSLLFSLSMQPFEHPLCTKDGIIFDLL